MSTIKVIENKASDVRKYLQRLGQYRVHQTTTLDSDVTIHGAVERYAYLALQATIDCAEAIIVYRKLRKPPTMRDSFLILQEDAVINRELADKMVELVKFRNILTHDYAEITSEQLYDFIHDGVLPIADFLAIVEKLS